MQNVGAVEKPKKVQYLLWWLIIKRAIIMPNFIPYHYNQSSMVVVNYLDQLQLGTFEHDKVITELPQWIKKTKILYAYVVYSTLQWLLPLQYLRLQIMCLCHGAYNHVSSSHSDPVSSEVRAEFYQVLVIELFSSTQNIMAFSGGDKYKPTTSCNFSSKSGSWLILNWLLRWGFRPASVHTLVDEGMIDFKFFGQTSSWPMRTAFWFFLRCYFYYFRAFK